MELDAAIKKVVKLSDLEIKDLKTRRIFVFADGKRTLRELFDLCGFNAEEGGAYAQELFDAGAIAYLDGASPVAVTQSAGSVSTQGAGSAGDFIFTEDEIEVLVIQMGKYVGPVATMLVRNTISPNQSATHQELKSIIHSLADNIDDFDKKQEFLNTVESDFQIS